MIQKNPFLKYLIKDEKKDIFHSSAYAKAQGGAAMGAASTESFAARMKVDRNRQVVRGYRDSRVMSEANKNTPRAKVYTPPEQGGGGARGAGNSVGAGAFRSNTASTSASTSDARRMMMPKRSGISIK